MRPDWSLRRVGPVLMSRNRCVCGFALACTATALAACGAAREDRSERSPLPRTYPIEMQSLAGCAIERLGKKYGKIQKTDFPDRYMSEGISDIAALIRSA